MQQTLDLGLPKREDSALKEFCRKAQDAAKKDLIALLLFGDVGRGDYYPTSSDVNLAVILKKANTQILKPFREPLRTAQAAMRLIPMFLSEDDLNSATDVFPTKFLLMKHHHLALFGDDPLTELAIDDTHLRLRCEQELRNLSIRLRAAFVRAARPERIEQILKSGISTLLNNIRVLNYLKKKSLPANDLETVGAAGVEFSLDTNLLEKGIQLMKKDFEPTADELPVLFEEMMELTRRAAKLADEMEV